jgi:polyhydroxyalkanoate synthesis repressor PhaR
MNHTEDRHASYMTTARRTAEATSAPKGGPRVLKKYPNRRLYDSQTSSYITLADVKKMVLASEPFEVRDAKTGEDLTRSILLQIILEEESAGVPMFSTQTLAQIIRFYGQASQAMMAPWLEQSMQAFADMQSRLLNPASYLEQSQKLMSQMQEQLSRQAGALFPGFTPPKK